MKKGQLSKEDIFRKSIELFSEKGIDKVSMRELAKHCGLSLGAFYYHFKNKDDLILHFYQASLVGHVERSRDYLKEAPKNLGLVMEWICLDRLNEFNVYKEMLKPLVFKIDPKSPLSPWADESYEIRKQSVQVFREVLNHCVNIKSETTLDFIARMLWLQHLVIIALWTSSDEEDNKGVLLLEESKKIWKWIPTFLKVPGSGKTLTTISRSLQKIGIWETYETS